MIAEIIAFTAVAMLAVAIYGFTSSRNLIRQLLSAEVAFNAAILLALLFMASTPNLGTMLTIVLIATVTGEIIIVLSLLFSMYRVTRSLDSESLEEGGV